METLEEVKEFRPIDLEIAEKLFNLEYSEWKPFIQAAGWYQKGYRSPRLENPEAKCLGDWLNELPYYSVNIEDAWQVIEHIRKNWPFSKRDRFEDELQIAVSERMGMDPLTGLVHFKTVPVHMEPVDICKAALKANSPNGDVT